jgi:hypothetical protein
VKNHRNLINDLIVVTETKGIEFPIGRGTHFSICNTPTNHAFCLLWDEDHDIRVFNPINNLFLKDPHLFDYILFVGERKAGLTITLYDNAPKDVYEQISKSICGKNAKLDPYLNGSYGEFHADGDIWGLNIFAYSNIHGHKHLINDEQNKVTTYLNLILLLYLSQP